jgi:purine-binding chemotaxis protein CheW
MSRRPPDPDEAAVLHARARQLAQRTGTPAAEAMLEVLVFWLADEQYAIETRQIDEVLSLRDLTPLPGTPAFVRGVLNRRGTILAVFDIKRLLGLPEHGLTDLHQVAVVSGNDMTIGLLVDTVVDVQMLPEGCSGPRRMPATVATTICVASPPNVWRCSTSSGSLPIRC